MDWKYLKRSTIITQFDSLIMPIVMYACPIWIPQITGDMLYTQWINEEVFEQQITTALAKLPCEQLHLLFLKWTLGSHKRTDNCAVWGDTGRYPLVISAIKQSIKYFERLQGLNDSGKLVEDAFSEQQKLDLPWYKVMSKIINFWHCSSDSNYSTGSLVKKQIIITFRSLWENCRRADGKLKFYNSIKTGFFAEDYLRLTQEPFKAVKYLIRRRMSSHRLHIETGRYQSKPVYQRICRCCTDVKNAELLTQLPYPEVHIESEEHILVICEFFKDAREQAPPH